MSWPGPGFVFSPLWMDKCLRRRVPLSSLSTKYRARGPTVPKVRFCPLPNVNTVSGKACSGFSQFSAAPAFLAMCVPDKHACNYRVVSRALKILHPLSQKYQLMCTLISMFPVPRAILSSGLVLSCPLSAPDYQRSWHAFPTALQGHHVTWTSAAHHCVTHLR